MFAVLYIAITALLCIKTDPTSKTRIEKIKGLFVTSMLFPPPLKPKCILQDKKTLTLTDFQRQT
jgi:hypothetical protein